MAILLSGILHSLKEGSITIDESELLVFRPFISRLLHKNSCDKELIDIFKFKLDFVRIHPFMVGNGRLSRLIMNGLLTAKGYPRIIIRNQDKGFYYDAIESSLRVGRYDAWLKFMLTYMKFMCELEDMFLLDIE